VSSFGVIKLFHATLVMAFYDLGSEVLTTPRERMIINLLVEVVPMSMNISERQVGSNRLEKMLKLLSVLIKMIVAACKS